MCVSDSDSLKFDNILKTQTPIDEEMEKYSETDLKALWKDDAFRPIWNGGIMHCHLSIKCQVAEKSGKLLYNGKLFNRSKWSWRPPKVIRMQGRLAREYTDPRNSSPEISIITARGVIIWLDACPCGGELLMDHRGFLYCKECNIVYE